MLTFLLMTASVLSFQAASAAPGRRLAAAEALSDGLAAARAEADAGAALERLVSRSLDVRADLRGARSAERAADRIGALVDAARWRAWLDRPEALPELADGLARVASDLAFEPLIEADLPAGFPAPTPVGEIELVHLPAYRMARTDFGAFGSQGAFFTLFRHIQSNDIPMTAPVEMSYEADGDGVRESTMAFLYAAPDVVPARAGSSVEIVDVGPLRVASLGCRGDATDGRIERARAELLDWIEARPGLAVAGELRVMGYNSPMVPTGRRYYEVQIPVRERERTVVDFTDPAEASRWSPVDDVVMGGRSDSDLVREPDGACVFRGRVSLEQGGGFASARRDLPGGALADAGSIVVACRGDGSTYKLRLRTSTLGDDAAWQASFATVAGAWTEHAFEPGDFSASRRGRAVPDAPPLAFEDVTGVGFLIANEQEGPFRLELRSIATR